MKEVMMRFVREDDGQDLIEYTLLLAFVCLASAALFINAGTTMANIWKVANNTLLNAQGAAGSKTADAARRAVNRGAGIQTTGPLRKISVKDTGGTMKDTMMRFVREEEGQDLIEYTLLLAFVCLASAGLFINAGTTMANIWKVANNTLLNAQGAAS